MRVGTRVVAWVLLAVAMAIAQQSAPSASSAVTTPSQDDQLPSAPEPQNNVPPPPPPQTPTTPAPARSAPAPIPFPENSSNQPDGSGSEPRDKMFTLSKIVNFVQVPVTVKDQSGRLVEGLLRRDFEVKENGVEQDIKFFTSDPFPLSAAVVFDLGMPESAIRKVNETMPALTAAFSQFDEIAFYTYGSNVERRLEWSAVNDQVAITLKRMKPKGRPDGVPVVGGPMGQAGPTVNGVPLDPGTPHVQTAPRQPSVLNDAILRAALDLSKRDKTRRKIIFVVGDGYEYHSSASYGDVLKVLLSNNILLYGVAVDTAGGVPGVRDLERIHLPGSGYGNLLPRYADATGGDVFSELSQENIETAYARATREARNQYTLGYTTRATPSSTYREIEVIVHRPNLRVTAKKGYYPLPVSGP